MSLAMTPLLPGGTRHGALTERRWLRRAGLASLFAHGLFVALLFVKLPETPPEDPAESLPSVELVFEAPAARTSPEPAAPARPAPVPIPAESPSLASPARPPAPPPQAANAPPPPQAAAIPPAAPPVVPATPPPPTPSPAATASVPAAPVLPPAPRAPVPTAPAAPVSPAPRPSPPNLAAAVPTPGPPAPTAPPVAGPLAAPPPSPSRPSPQATPTPPVPPRPPARPQQASPPQSAPPRPAPAASPFAGTRFMPDAAQSLARPPPPPPAAPAPRRNTTDLALGPAPRPDRSPAVPALRGEDNVAGSALRITGANLGADWRAAFQEWLRRNGHYPREAAMNGEDGVTMVRFEVDPQGRVQWVRLITRSGSQFLDIASTALLRDRTIPPFPPGTQGGNATIELTINYILVRR